ncbi:MAG: YggS family pyridoxal phosphate-dependent enzyme [Chloroflexi bacterium]|nr:YggS family pyridoxal phosphate-dependent enzyme [Chloroflexota bacterium]
MVTKIRENLERIQERIETAASSAGRNPAEIRLVVVTKAQPVEVVGAAITAGAVCLGENYAEEAVAKMGALGKSPNLEWHMIGHVQSRKARLVCNSFDLVHSLDSIKLAERYNQFAGEAGRKLPVLLEFNLGGEETKFGWPAWKEEYWEDLTPVIEEVTLLANLQVMGLMTMPPLMADPEQSRVFFRRLKQLQQYLVQVCPQVDWRELSMGTSADFEVAIQEGATYVRVGQAILGPRPAR